MALSPGDLAIIAAIELLRSEIAKLPLAVAQNAASGTAEAVGRQFDTLGFGRDEGFGSRAPQTGFEDVSRPGRVGALLSGAAWSLAKPLGLLTGMSTALVSSFGRLLLPLAAFHTFLNTTTAGVGVFSRALVLFSSALGPLILPLVYSLSAGLAAASDVLFRKLVPALDGFNRWVLSTAIPAVTQFADTVGRATVALRALADSRAGRALGAAAGDSGGGRFGALNRTLDRIGSISGDAENPDRGVSFAGRVELAGDDLARLVPGGGSLVGAKDWLRDQLGFEAPKVTGGTSPETDAAATRARRETLQELILSMGPKGGVGSGATSVWSRAASAAISQSPFERRMLEMMQKVVGALAKAERAEPGGATFKPSGGGPLAEMVEFTRRSVFGRR